METRRLGRSGASVGVIGLGTSTWGRGTDPAEAADQVRALVDAGGNLIVIEAQATPAHVVAKAIVAPGARASTFVALRTPAMPSRRELLASLDDFVASTGIGHADIWLIDGWSPGEVWDEVVASLAVATASGRALYAGLAPAEPWHAALVGGAMTAHADCSPLSAVAVRTSLLDAAAQAASDVAVTLDASVLAVGTLAGGVLTGKYRHATPPDSRGAGERHAADMHRYREPWTWPVVDALCAAAEGLGVSPTALALAWARDRPGVASAVVGARTIHQWRAAVDSVEVTLPSEIRHVLDEVATKAGHVRHDGPQD